jgi:CelD/BcsL family acetyltransferase involved in cellulose biosynthesis
MKKNEEKQSFFNRPGMEDYFRKLFTSLPEVAKIRCLSVHGVLAASIYYFETPTSFLLYNSGFDKENYDSAGLYLKALHIKQAISQGKKTYNFLQGNERYKYELGGKDFFVYRITLNLR